jgi:hypothetical protein
MRKLLYAFVVGVAVATIIFYGVALFTTWTVIHSGRSESEVNSYFVGLTIASLAIGGLAGSWWYGWARRRAARASTRPH